jgi:hypothetical protein
MDWIKCSKIPPPTGIELYFSNGQSDFKGKLENCPFVPVLWTTLETLY